MQKPFSQACENNKIVIAEQLRIHFGDASHILEIGSGTGQHAVYCAEKLPHLIWQTSDQPQYHAGIAMWLEQYRSALAKIKEWEEVADVARSHIEAALGDAEVGYYKGQQVVRYTTVTSTRFDVKRAKELVPPQVLDVLQVQSNSRRFTLVNQDAQ